MRVWMSPLASIVILMCVLGGCGTVSEDVKMGNGLFSWSSAVFEEQLWDQVFELMHEQNLTVLYQAFPQDLERDTLKAFMQDAAKQGILVYLLTGAPEWGLDASGAEMQSEVRRAAIYNRRLPKGAKLQGVIMDTEPYLTEEWDDHPADVMNNYVAGMEITHYAAQKAGLQLIACIPYYFDSQGFEAQLCTLIQSGCDGLAIMNYYKEDEAKHIATEMTLAQKADIPVTVIYELQKPDRHDLVEANTYYYDGLEAVADSIQLLESYFGTGSFTYAFHDYEALQEVIANE